MRVTKETQGQVAEAAWALALRHVVFGYAEISAGLKISMKQATRIVTGWEREHAIRVVQDGVGLRKLFEADRDFTRLAAPQSRTPEENLWTAMRGLRSFAPTDLAAHASTEAVPVPLDKAAEYCRLLLAGGYLRVARKADPSKKREAIYALIRVTGPRAPRARRVRAIVDANTDEVLVIGGEQ